MHRGALTQRFYALAVFALFFLMAPSAHAATLYFHDTNTSPLQAAFGNWNYLSNWWTDAAFTQQAVAFPTAGDDVIITSNLNITATGTKDVVNTLTAKGDSVVQVFVTATNGASFEDSSENHGTITGDACFASTATNGPLNFVALGQTRRYWWDVAVAPNGNIYATDSGPGAGTPGDVYVKTGTGDFAPLGQSKVWYGIDAAADGDIYAPAFSFGPTDIYKQTNSAGAFNALNQTNRLWRPIAAAPNGDVYAAVFVNGDIYKQTNGAGDFIALSQTSRNWNSLGAAPNGDIYAGVSSGDIYKQTSGAGDFIALGTGLSGNWLGFAFTSNGDIYASNGPNFDIYKQTGGSGSFVSMNQGIRNWGGMASDANDNVYVTDLQQGDIYKLNNEEGLVTGSVSSCAASIPTVTTGASVEISPSLVILFGSIDETGGESASTRGFEYGLTTSYGSTTSESGAYVAEDFNIFASNLSCGTTYHYRTFADNSAGTGYGDDATFTTPACGPTSILYGVDGSGQNPDAPQLYTIDPATGDTTAIGAVGANITGLAFQPTTTILYGVSGSNGTHPKSLFTISTTTGVGTWLGTIKDGSNTALNMPDISFRSDGTLYGWSGSDKNLYTIDLTSCNGGGDTNCLATKVGDSGRSGFGNGLTFTSDDTLFLFDNADFDDYREIDPDTGTVVATRTFTNPNVDFCGSINAATANESNLIFASAVCFGSTDPEDPSRLMILDTSTDENYYTQDNDDLIFMDALAFLIQSAPPDTTAPAITILGSNPAEVLQKNTYTDAGATAEDDTDGDLTSSITTTGSVDTQTLGTYEIVYQVTDAADNTAYATRTVEVISRDSNSGTGSSGSHHNTGGSSGSHQGTSTDDTADTARLEHLITILQQILNFLMGKGVLPSN